MDKTKQTIALVKKSAQQFGQKVGDKEARRIAALLIGWRK